MTSISLASLVNRPEEHEACRRSLLGEGADARVLDWHVVRADDRGWNAARGLNSALDRAEGDWVILVHQDVRFPRGWIDRFVAQVSRLPVEVAVLGVAGATRAGAFRGHVVDPNGHCRWPPAASDVLTLDECLLAVRGASAARFDEAVPGFHCYGAEYCLRMVAEGRRVRTLDAPVLHLSSGRIDAAYAASSAYVLGKWGATYRHYVPSTAALIADPVRAPLLRRALGRLVRWRSRMATRRDCGSAECRELVAALRNRERK